jgi:hypothetical protein
VSPKGRLTDMGLLDQICRQISFGKAVKATMSARAPSRCTYRLVVEEIENLEPLDPSTTGDAVDGLHW